MSDIIDVVSLKNYLLSLKGVTFFELPALKLRRFLMHDVPFAVLSPSKDGGEILNIRLGRAKMKELSSRYPQAVAEPGIYGETWISLYIDWMPCTAVKDALLTSYTRQLETLSASQRLLYLDNNAVPYDLDYHKILEQTKLKVDIEYGKKFVNPKKK